MYKNRIKKTFMSRKRAITTFLSRKFIITRSWIAFEDFLGSSIAPQVMPSCVWHIPGREYPYPIKENWSKLKNLGILQV